MSIASIVTRGYIDGVNFIPTRGYTPGNAPPPVVITGGHFLPAQHKKKRTLSNVQVIYEKAQQLPRKETKELRDAISEFIAPSLARKPILPDIIKVDYEALKLNDMAYEKFSQAIKNIEERIEIQQIAEEDDELFMLAISLLA